MTIINNRRKIVSKLNRTNSLNKIVSNYFYSKNSTINNNLMKTTIDPSIIAIPKININGLDTISKSFKIVSSSINKQKIMLSKELNQLAKIDSQIENLRIISNTMISTNFGGFSNIKAFNDKIEKKTKWLSSINYDAMMGRNFKNIYDISNFEALLRSYSTKNKHINSQLQDLYKTPNIAALIPTFTDKQFQSQLIKGLNLSSDMSQEFSELFSILENISSSEKTNDLNQENTIDQNHQKLIHTKDQCATKNAVKDINNNYYDNHNNEQDKHLTSHFHNAIIIILIYIISIIAMIDGNVKHNNNQIFISNILNQVADTLVFAYDFSKND